MNTETRPGWPEDAWFAGFFDGEGCVGIAPSYDTSLYLLKLQLSNTEIAPLLLFKERFGGCVLKPSLRPSDSVRRKPCGQWKCDSKVAEAALRAMLPHLVVKRERTLLALEFRELFKGEFVLPRGREKNHPENVVKRERVLRLRSECYARMRVLNKRGI